MLLIILITARTFEDIQIFVDCVIKMVYIFQTNSYACAEIGT